MPLAATLLEVPPTASSATPAEPPVAFAPPWGSSAPARPRADHLRPVAPRPAADPTRPARP
eukprot:CAMPEP_0115519056 /NCGR_PEP_ID=MMETSP0271-20121206/78227_1 /TAXON_ID=71861 /ORGANISM="Scrippsiella trochoidea, Strain CCMP3099" /LENGTH=60 /DNA_ID=CAMNT_0002950031 /DNA_START=6 /DNA_END=185 /DNA_ORIENTATION=-